VIDFRMVGNHVVDCFQIDVLFQVLNILFGIRRPDRIDDGDLFLFDQIGIVG
jgi:hypothetical protein